MAKPKLNDTQRKEVAYLINAGASPTLLAEKYNVDPKTIKNISLTRYKYIDAKDLAETEDQKFVFAQMLYRYEGIEKGIRDYVRSKILLGIVTKIVNEDKAKFDRSAEILEKIFGKQEETTSKINDDLLRRIDYGLEILKTSMIPYITLKDAYDLLPAKILEVEEEKLPASEKKKAKDLQTKVNEVIRSLSYKERELLRLKPVAKEGIQYTIESAGRLLEEGKDRLKKAGVKKALDTLKEKGKKKLKGFLDSLVSEE